MKAALSAVGLIPFALLAAATVAIVDPDQALAALALAVPVTWAGVAGAVVSVVRDAPDPLAAPSASNIVPPEVAGFTSTIRLLWPLAISVVGVVPVALAVEFPSTESVVRGAVASLLLVLAVAFWVRRRDEWRRKLRDFIDQGQAATKAARSTT